MKAPDVTPVRIISPVERTLDIFNVEPDNRANLVQAAIIRASQIMNGGRFTPFADGNELVVDALSRQIATRHNLPRRF